MDCLSSAAGSLCPAEKEVHFQCSEDNSSMGAGFMQAEQWSDRDAVVCRAASWCRTRSSGILFKVINSFRETSGSSSLFLP